MSTAYNYKYQKVKNFRPEQHDVEISIGIGLMLILIVATFIYFYTDTTLVNYPPLKHSNITLPAHP
jgi:multisubunit Na+/H+ antiporter MnhB subunit